MKKSIKQAWVWLVDIALILAGLIAWLIAVAILLTIMYTKCSAQSLLPTMAEMSSNGQIYNISLDRGELCMTSQRPAKGLFVSLKIQYLARKGNIYYLHGYEGWYAVAKFNSTKIESILFTKGSLPAISHLQNVKKNRWSNSTCPLCHDPDCPGSGYNSSSSQDNQ